MARLVLGPLLRYTGEDDATIWVETDAACEVEVLGCRERTFHVEGHHYALVHVTGLEPATTTPYEVRLDGERVWPEPDSPYPPSVIRTVAGDGAFRIAWGSCRVDAPHSPPYSLRKDEHPDGREVDALRVLADHMCRDGDPADVAARARAARRPGLRRRGPAGGARAAPRRARRRALPPYETVANFEEYTWLYRESWSEPHIRWLLSTVPSAMIFDDHDVHDDWNTSKTWVETMRATGWWDERIVGGFATYWLYQHMGNLSPQHLAQDDLYAALRAADDGGPLLREFAFRADREVAGTRWSYCRDFGRSRLVMIDSRAGRVLDPPEDRSMLDPDEWNWLEEHVAGDFDHLLLGTSLPLLLAPGLHYLESWNEAVCNGAWGGPAARLGERMRQAVDLEHWAAFGTSLERLVGLVRDVGTGEKARRPPRSSRSRATCTTRTSPRSASRAGRACGRRSTRRRARRSATRSTRTSGARSASPAAAPARSSGSCSPAPPASAIRRSAGASRRRRRTSTTRSASSSSTAAAPGCGCRRRSRRRTRATPWRRSSSRPSPDAPA